MATPCIITVAITGSVPKKANNGAVPVTVTEQIESTHEAYEAGAALVHIHVRDENENPTVDVEKFAAVRDGVVKHCPGMIIQFSTGGRTASGTARGAMLALAPDMASLATGSCNFPSRVYDNPPTLIETLARDMRLNGVKPEIEVFDVAMLTNAARYVEEGLLDAPLHVQFVMGVKNALPARRDILEFQVSLLGKLLPGASWVAAGIGKDQLIVNKWCLELGGHLRTGLEDNIRMDATTLAPSNAALVARAAKLCEDMGRPVATPAQARRILGLRQAAIVSPSSDRARA